LHQQQQLAALVCDEREKTSISRVFPLFFLFGELQLEGWTYDDDDDERHFPAARRRGVGLRVARELLVKVRNSLSPYILHAS
jgi:hypothetical protein